LGYSLFGFADDSKPLITVKDWDKHYSKKLKRTKSEIKSESKDLEKEKKAAYKISKDKLDGNLDKINEKFMYRSLNHFEFNKKKRKQYKIQNKPFDRFVIEVLVNHIDASHYLYSWNEQSKDERKEYKRNIISLEDINFLKTQFTAYANSKFDDEKEHLENKNSIKLKTNQKLVDFKSKYKNPIAPPKELNLNLKEIRSFHDYVLFMEGFDLVANDSKDFNEKLYDLELSKIEQQKEASIAYINQIVEQATSVLNKDKVKENSEFLKLYLKKFKSKSSKMENELTKLVNDIKIDSAKLSSIEKTFKMKLQEFINDYAEKAGPFKKKISISEEKLYQLLNYFRN
jgi:hypothetical protein